MSQYVNNAADCTVKQFKACCFDQRFRVLVIDGDPSDQELQEAFELIYSQYVDLSGLFISREFELSAYIHSLEIRITSIERFVELQERFIEEFNSPFTPAFPIAKRYGHTLYWNPDSPDIDQFKAKLSRIKGGEAKYIVELKKKKTELFDLHKKRANKEFTLLESRKQFVTMLNRLQQAKFVIDQKETTVEELALMIADQKEQQDDAIAQRSFKRT